MIKNYIKIAWRNLLKHRLFSFINIVGLGIAIPFALLSLLQLQSSFEFDNWHQDRERIYRVITDEVSLNGSVGSFASSPYLLSSELEKNYPAIENSSHIVRTFGWELGNRLKTDNVNTIFTDLAFFNIFSFPLEQGVYPTEPFTIVLSKEKAEWYFGDADPIGKSLEHSTHGEFKIVGVLKEFKPKTQFKTDVILSMSTFEKINPMEDISKTWQNLNSHTFVKLIEKAEPIALQQAITKLSGQISKEYTIADGNTLAFKLQQFKDISPATKHLEFNPYVEDMQDIYFNFSIPLMILLLAGFNYTNLTLARSINRAKEVGVRKVMGAERFQLVFQFLFEAIIISFLALLLGLFLLWVMRQYIHVEWLTWEVDRPYLAYIAFGIFALFLGVLAGIFPALILSNFQPVKILKGILGPSSLGKFGFRKALTVIQFAVTLAFVFQIGHLYNQFKFMATENESFNRKGIYNLSLLEGTKAKLHKELIELKEVESLGYTSQTFGNVPSEIEIKATKKSDAQKSFYYAADYQFIENMHLEFLAGDNLPISSSDSAGSFVIVNETALRELGLGSPSEAIGKQIFLKDEQSVLINGVVKDFCNFNYQFELYPVLLQYNPQMFRIASLKTTENLDQGAFEEKVSGVWAQSYPNDEAVGSWLAKDLYERYYPAEDMKIMAWASWVVFLIAVMGLLGILTYTIEKRVKEIGIRKVMGATVKGIVKLISWSFIKLLLIATVIALPIGWASGLLMNKLFIFNNGVNYLYMAILVLVIIGIALLTTILSSFRSAEANPAISLKSD